MAPGRNRFDHLRVLRRLARPIEVVQVRLFGRSILSLAARTSALLLHTTGRRSGVERTTPLAFHQEAEGVLLVVGGAGGQARLPDWVVNLRSTPTGSVTLDRVRFDVISEELLDEERAQVWPRLVGVWPRIEVYRRRAGRVVPVFRLVRSDHPDPEFHRHPKDTGMPQGPPM